MKRGDEVGADKTRIEAEAAIIDKEKTTCQAQLDKALPALFKAQQAASKITIKDISELKGNSNPHIIMKYVVDGMAILLGKRVRSDIIIVEEFAKKADRDENKNGFLIMQDSWNHGGKVAFFDSDLVKDLQKMADEKNENLINDEILELIEPYTRAKDIWLTTVNAKNASSAIAALREWMVQIESFSINTKVIKPKRLALRQQMEKLAVAMASLSEAEAQ